MGLSIWESLIHCLPPLGEVLKLLFSVFSSSCRIDFPFPSVAAPLSASQEHNLKSRKPSVSPRLMLVCILDHQYILSSVSLRCMKVSGVIAKIGMESF